MNQKELSAKKINVENVILSYSGVWDVGKSDKNLW